MIKLPVDSISFFNENYLEIFETGNLAEGNWNRKISEWACTYTSSDYALATNSNGGGIFAILKILKQYKSKKKIFLQSNTMYGVKTMATSSGLDLCGYVDCELDYLMPTYDQVKKFIDLLENPSECVFLLTHIGGWVNPEIEIIAQLCKENDVALVEDCAHTLGSTLKGQHTGLFGIAGVYSLYATKAIPVGEGGIIITKDEELHQMLEKFLMYDRFDQELDIGVNLRMSEINALLSYAVIKETETIIQNKYEIAEKYIKACEKYGWNYINPTAKGQRSNLYKFILLSNLESPEKDFLQITNRTSPVYDYALGNDLNELTRRHICLPIWYLLEDKIVDSVLFELKR
ncbi:DegT/DnrJ/EryC1/StrS family aminotransferase [Candidatus Pseudothioglobus singularis]|nr:DegT/DnrJ/EryC1/StrS family aminotransferase [Candidatus Pseudothioglobus singularis]